MLNSLQDRQTLASWLREYFFFNTSSHQGLSWGIHLLQLLLGANRLQEQMHAQDTHVSAKRANVVYNEEYVLITRLVKHIDNSRFCVDKMKMMAQDRWAVLGSKLFSFYLRHAEHSHEIGDAYPYV